MRVGREAIFCPPPTPPPSAGVPSSPAAGAAAFAPPPPPFFFLRPFRFTAPALARAGRPGSAAGAAGAGGGSDGAMGLELPGPFAPVAGASTPTSANKVAPQAAS